MSLEKILKSFAAGLAGTAAHVVLMFLKDRLGLLPQFQPYDEIQRGLSMLVGADVPAWAASAMALVNGALVWGFVFGRVFRALPGGTPLRKGLFFGLCAWAFSGLALFPALGRGLFAWDLGLGAAPAALMLVMLCVWALSMSFAYAALTHDSDSARP
jgi:hypothetical protein